MFYFNIFKKYLKIILIITVISSLITSIFVFFIVKPKYRGSCSILPPFTIKDDQAILYLLTPDEIKNFIQDESFIYTLSKITDIPFEKIRGNLVVRTPVKSNNVLLIFEDNDKERIDDFLLEIFNLLKERDKKLESYKEGIENQLNMKQEEKEKIIEEIDRIKKEIEEFDSNNKSKLEYYLEYSMLWSSLSTLSESLRMINSDIPNLTKQKVLTQDFTFFNPPSVLDEAVSPKKFLDIGITFILAIVIAFLFTIIYERTKKK